jgi:hypothetical protein
VTAAAAIYREAIDCTGPGDMAVVVACRIVLGFLEGSRGHLTRSLSLAEEVARAAQVAGPEARQRFPQAWLATVLAVMDRFDETVFAGYPHEAEEFGASWALAFCQRSVTYVRMMAGRLSDAATEAEATLALIDAFDMWQDCDIPFGVLAVVSIHRDDLEAASARLARARQYRPLRGHAPPRYLDLAEPCCTRPKGITQGRCTPWTTCSIAPRYSSRTCRSSRPSVPVSCGWPGGQARRPVSPPSPTPWTGSRN